MSDNHIELNKKYQELFKNKNVRYYIIYGGRGSAKSFAVSTFLVNLLCEQEKHKILFTRYTMTAAEISIIPEFSEKIDILGMEKQFDIQKKEITNIGNDNMMLFRGIKTSSGNQTANLKSIKGITTWVLDEAEELTDEDTFDKIDNSIRMKGVHNRVILVLNPPDVNHFIYKKFFEGAMPGGKNVPNEFTGVIDDTLFIHTSFLDNLAHLDESFPKRAEKQKKKNPVRFNNIFMGHWAQEVEGALWRQKIHIDPFRVVKHPELKRIVVSIDPNVTSSGSQDEVGIVVAGLGFDNHGYLLADSSGDFGPQQWKNVVVAEFKNYQAENILAEVNNGGDLVKMTIRTVEGFIPVKEIRATRGKLIRAEPISSLCEDGLIHHVGSFGKLEYQLTSYIGDGDSPGRLDAYVMAFIELFNLDIGKAPDFIVM